jgi:predicted transcriptional regulator
MAEIDLDTALSVLSNPMRRDILSLLVMETHYPLQLAKELNTSQQAVMKHLGVLEKHGLVKSDPEPSDAGGPPRNAFTATKQLSIRIDIGPNLYNAKMRTFDPDEETQFLDDYSYINDRYDILRAVDDDHERLKGERLLGEANDLIAKLSSDYDERRVLYYITDRGTGSVSVISEHFNMREKTVEEIFFQLLRNRLLFDDRSLLLGPP